MSNESFTIKVYNKGILKDTLIFHTEEVATDLVQRLRKANPHESIVMLRNIKEENN